MFISIHLYDFISCIILIHTQYIITRVQLRVYVFMIRSRCSYLLPRTCLRVVQRESLRFVNDSRKPSPRNKPCDDTSFLYCYYKHARYIVMALCIHTYLCLFLFLYFSPSLSSNVSLRMSWCAIFLFLGHLADGRTAFDKTPWYNRVIRCRVMTIAVGSRERRDDNMHAHKTYFYSNDRTGRPRVQTLSDVCRPVVWEEWERNLNFINKSRHTHTHIFIRNITISALV